MSVVIAVASGIVDVNDETFKMLRREVRKELRAYRIQLVQQGSLGSFSIWHRTKRGGHRIRSHLGRGDLVEVCKQVHKIITPSDHNPAE